jgi:hypothetical protein
MMWNKLLVDGGQCLGRAAWQHDECWLVVVVLLPLLCYALAHPHLWT